MSQDRPIKIHLNFPKKPSITPMIVDDSDESDVPKSAINSGDQTSNEDTQSDHYEEDEEEDNEEEEGYLLYLYSGNDNGNEKFIFRQLCMRYGLQAWDEMHAYLPWRTRAELRTKLMKMIRKQAIGEYSQIKADPVIINEDNMKLKDEKYVFKNGLWVNQQWDQSHKEKAEIRNYHKERYNLDTEESLNVDILPILNVDYIVDKMKLRKLALLLFNASLNAEKARRAGTEPPDLGLDGISFIPAKEATLKRAKTKLKWTRETDDYIFDVDKFKD